MSNKIVTMRNFINMKLFIPKYQRGQIWGINRKRIFIETIMNGEPIQEFMLTKIGNSNVIYIHDGYQRHSTINSFLSGEISYGESKPFRLFNDLSKTEKLRFYNKKISLEIHTFKNYKEASEHFLKVQFGCQASIGECIHAHPSELVNEIHKLANDELILKYVNSTRYKNYAFACSLIMNNKSFTRLAGTFSNTGLVSAKGFLKNHPLIKGNTSKLKSVYDTINNIKSNMKNTTDLRTQSDFETLYHYVDREKNIKNIKWDHLTGFFRKVRSNPNVSVEYSLASRNAVNSSNSKSIRLNELVKYLMK